MKSKDHGRLLLTSKTSPISYLLILLQPTTLSYKALMDDMVEQADSSPLS